MDITVEATDADGGISLGKYGYQLPAETSLICAVSWVLFEIINWKIMLSRKRDIMIIYKADWYFWVYCSLGTTKLIMHMKRIRALTVVPCVTPPSSTSLNWCNFHLIEMWMYMHSIYWPSSPTEGSGQIILKSTSLNLDKGSRIEVEKDRGLS